MSDPIDKAIDRTALLSYMTGGVAVSVVSVFDLSFPWPVFVGAVSAIPIAYIGWRAKRKIYGHVYDAIRSRQGRV